MGEIVILIAGIPPGVKVGIFDEEKEKGNPDRPILLEEAARSDYILEKTISESYVGKKVNVVIRSAGFKPYSFKTKIAKYGLFHAAYLEIDRIYSGTKSKIPSDWNSVNEHRKAEEQIINLINVRKSK